MASSVSMQSILVNPVAVGRLGHRCRPSSMVFPSTYFPRQQKNGCTLQVRCMAEQESRKEQKSSPVNAPPSPSQPTFPSASPKVSTKFTDVLAFSGPAPERINGRLAMIGFVAAMAVELANGDDVAAQLANGGLTWFLGTTAVLSLASLIPLFKGVDVQSKSKGLMTSDAELWNGRFAMLGLVALVFTEYVKGGALI